MTVTRAAGRPQGMRRTSVAAAVLLCLVAGCGDKSGGDSGGASGGGQKGEESDPGLGATPSPDAGSAGQGTGGQDTGSGTDSGGGVGAPWPHHGGGAHAGRSECPSGPRAPG